MFAPGRACGGRRLVLDTDISGKLGQSGPIIMTRGRRAAGWEVGPGLEPASSALIRIPLGAVRSSHSATRIAQLVEDTGLRSRGTSRAQSPQPAGQARLRSWGGEATAGPQPAALLRDSPSHKSVRQEDSRRGACSRRYRRAARSRLVFPP